MSSPFRTGSQNDGPPPEPFDMKFLTPMALPAFHRNLTTSLEDREGESLAYLGSSRHRICTYVCHPRHPWQRKLDQTPSPIQRFHASHCLCIHAPGSWVRIKIHTSPNPRANHWTCLQRSQMQGPSVLNSSRSDHVLQFINKKMALSQEELWRCFSRDDTTKEIPPHPNYQLET